MSLNRPPHSQRDLCSRLKRYFKQAVSVGKCERSVRSPNFLAIPQKYTPGLCAEGILTDNRVSFTRAGASATIRSMKGMSLSFAVLCIAVAGIASYWLYGINSPASGARTDLQIAADAARFVDASLNEKTGTYDLFFTCSSDKETCNVLTDPSRPPHMGYAIMSLDHVGRATGDARLVNKAKLLIDQAVEKCGADQRYCEWNFFPLHYYAKTTGEGRYREAMLKISDKIMAERPVRELLDNNLGIKLWLLYDVTKDEKYRERLTRLADEQLETYPVERLNDPLVYEDDGGNVYLYDLPIMWALYVPAYNATKDAKYLEPVTEFFDSARLEKHLWSFWNVSATGNLVKGIETLLDISDADPARRDAYRAKARILADSLMRERWDTPERPLVNGDYGLLVSPTEKATNVQGWLIHSLLELADVDTDHRY